MRNFFRGKTAQRVTVLPPRGDLFNRPAKIFPFLPIVFIGWSFSLGKRFVTLLSVSDLPPFIDRSQACLKNRQRV
jgi:hypothetical protein